MTPKELQIGDWVIDTYTNKPMRIEVINPEMGDGLEPIPLTAEILDKNGFVHSMSHNWLNVIDNIMIELLEPQHNMAIWLDWTEYDTETYASYLLPGPNCVHELQHALRLCGINEDIEI